jgi:multidrug resistance efflux pump
LGGRVKAVLVEEGATVEPGQLLVQFEDQEYVVRRAAAQRALLRARQVPRALTTLMERRAAEMDYVSALDAYERSKGLDSEALAKKHLERSTSARERIFKAPPGDALAEQLADDVRLADLALAELAVRSPAHAVVDTLALRPGDLMPPGRPIAVLIESGRAYVQTYINETDAGWLAIGMKVVVQAGSAARHIDAEIQHIAATPEYSPRHGLGERADGGPQYAVRLRIAPDAGLRPGTAVRVTIAPPGEGK